MCVHVYVCVREFVPLKETEREGGSMYVCVYLREKARIYLLGADAGEDKCRPSHETP